MISYTYNYIKQRNYIKQSNSGNQAIIVPSKTCQTSILQTVCMQMSI